MSYKRKSDEVLLLLLFVVTFVVFVVLSWSDCQLRVLTRAGSPATARYRQPVRSSRTGSVQSWRPRGSSVSFPPSLSFLARLPLPACLPLLPPVSLQPGDPVQSSQAVLSSLALLSHQPGLALEEKIFFSLFLF